MADIYIDAVGHKVNDINGASLVASTSGTSVAGTVVPVAAGAGAGSTVTAVNANDRRGSFTLTAAGTPAAGRVASVFFAAAYSAIPAVVTVTIVNVTDTTAPVTISANAITQAGFDLVSTVLVAGKAYLVQYIVEP